MLQIGSVVDNKYKILNEVGHGGMSTVYLAINERANKTWAIKEVRKDGVCDFEAVKQGLVVETDMLKRLSHPHLPSIIDVIDAEDSFYIVMDYIEGKSLQSVLRHGGAQPEEMVLEWGKQLCDVLGYLHSRVPPIIYRDMKPANVMLKPDGNITLIDFGTAREFKNRAMVEDTTCLGTRGYAAPEQFGGRGQTDARTDIYCLGATLYHLLTGHSPAEPPYEIKPLRYWNAAWADTGLEKLILKCTQQDPAARYQNCEELMYALEHVEDEDTKAIKARKRKLRLFIGSIAVCLLGVAGMIGFGLAKGSAKKQTYSYLVGQIKQSSISLDERQTLCKQAVEINPGNPEAYEALLHMMVDDRKLDEDEKLVVQNIFSTKQNSSFSSVAEENPAAYDEMQFNLGYAYYFFCDPTEKNANYAADRFSTVTESSYLDSRKLQLCQSLHTITSSYQKLNDRIIPGLSDDEYTYEKFITDLAVITDGEIEQTLGEPLWAVYLYKQVAFLIGENCVKFKSSGLLSRVDPILNNIENGLNRLSASLDESNLKEARANLETAWEKYNTVKDNRG